MLLDASTAAAAIIILLTVTLRLISLEMGVIHEVWCNFSAIHSFMCNFQGAI